MNRKTTALTSAMLCLMGLLPACQQQTSSPRADVADDQPVVVSSTPKAAQQAASRLFDDASVYGETRALLVLRDGQTVYERYADGFGPDSKLISWSMAKTITAVLAGLLVSDGRLSLDGPASVPAWQRPGDPRGAITLRQLLHMSSGLSHVENGDPVWTSDTVRMLVLDGAHDMAGYAESQPPVARPNERYVYSSATSVIVSDIITRTLTPSNDPAVRRQAMDEFIRGRLMEPLGMASLRVEYDPKGTLIGGSIMHATARDYARFGEFLRNRGVANGQQIVPESWVDFMLTPSSTDPGYGGHVWLNHERPTGSPRNLWPAQGPADLFAMLGHAGQFVIVSPRQKLTIIRLGVSTEPQIDAVRDELQKITAAF